MTKKRLVYFIVTFLFIGGLWWKLFYTDKRHPTGPVEAPLAWLTDKVLLTGERERLFIRTENSPRAEIFRLRGNNEEFSFGTACIGRNVWWFGRENVTRSNGSIRSALTPVTLSAQDWSDAHSKVKILQEHDRFARPMLPSCGLDISQNTTTSFLRGSASYQNEHSISIDGELVKLGNIGGKFAKQIEGNLYLDRESAGLLHLRGKEITRHPFPRHSANSYQIGWRLNSETIIWDRSLGRALLINKTCPSKNNRTPCRRKALWLTSSLEPLSTVEIPGDSLIKIKGGYSCFSCGCECYSHEAIYVENGTIYAHVWGYPVVNSVRGIYRLKQTENGPKWEKIVSGRPQPPLAFSPEGNKVAFFEISRFGDEFRIAEFPAQ